MDIYHHLENTKVYLKLSNSANIYELDILPGGASFSQTFTETTYATKTLHSQGSLIEEGVIKKANPASFSFGIPLLKENDFDTPIFNTLVDLTTESTLNTFTLWFIESTKAFTIENCVLTGGTFNIQKSSILSLSLEGQGTKLTAADNNGVEIISSNIDFSNVGSELPTFTLANLQARSSTRTFLPLMKVISQRSDTSINGNVYDSTPNSEENLLSANVELQNSIEWTEYRTVAGGIAGTSRETVEYPSTFTLRGRVIAGNSKWAIPTAGASETATNFGNTSAFGGANQHFYENSPWTTAAFSTISNIDYGIIFKAASGVNITTRVSPGPFYTMDMDWRLASNASPISSLLTYTTA